jgi:hypothetical protein
VLGAGEHQSQRVECLATRISRSLAGFGGLVDRKCTDWVILSAALPGGRHLDPSRVVEIGAAQFFHLLRHGGREEHRLARRAEMRCDTAQGVDEAHVEHLVGFIQHEVCGPNSEVDRTPRSIRSISRPGVAINDMGAAGQDADLAVDRLPAHDGC